MPLLKPPCGTCGENESKYNCPGCGIRSCSLDCVKRHKSGVDACDGVRKKSTYIPLNQLTDKDFEKDYVFMASAFDTLGSIQRDKLRKITSKGEHAIPLPVSACRFINANRMRGCRYLKLPLHFERRKTNTSFLNYARNRISWKVEWHFPHADDTILVEKDFDELTNLGDYLMSVVSLRSKVRLEEEDKDLISLHPFIQYEAAGYGGFKALLKIEGLQNDPYCTRFEELDLKKTLRANLRDKTVVEHPIIYLVLNHHVSSFTYKDPINPSPSWLRNLEGPGNKFKENAAPKKEESFGLVTHVDSDSEEKPEAIRASIPDEKPMTMKQRSNQQENQSRTGHSSVGKNILNPKKPKMDEEKESSSTGGGLFLVQYSDSDEE